MGTTGVEEGTPLLFLAAALEFIFYIINMETRNAIQTNFISQGFTKVAPCV
jgi:hypothetical protein